MAPTFAMPFRFVAAVSHAGARFLQCPPFLPCQNHAQSCNRERRRTTQTPRGVELDEPDVIRVEDELSKVFLCELDDVGLVRVEGAGGADEAENDEKERDLGVLGTRVLHVSKGTTDDDDVMCYDLL